MFISYWFKIQAVFIFILYKRLWATKRNNCKIVLINRNIHNTIGSQIHGRNHDGQKIITFNNMSVNKWKMAHENFQS